MLNSNRLSRFRVCLMASLVIGAAVTPAVGGEQYHKPKIRTITAFVRIEPATYRQQLAERWSEGTFDLDSLLAYSAVCGTGLDAIPLPGDVSQQQLERIIGDMASLAFKWHKPLTARLIPAPGKKAGDQTDFDFGIAKFPNTTLKPLR